MFMVGLCAVPAPIPWQRVQLEEQGNILTTSFEENDQFDWPDGTHHHDCAHVALGNNERRDVVVHGPRHMDGEIRKPTISIDGRVITENGVFLDEALKKPQG